MAIISACKVPCFFFKKEFIGRGGGGPFFLNSSIRFGGVSFRELRKKKSVLFFFFFAYFFEH